MKLLSTQDILDYNGCLFQNVYKQYRVYEGDHLLTGSFGLYDTLGKTTVTSTRLRRVGYKALSNKAKINTFNHKVSKTKYDEVFFIPFFDGGHWGHFLTETLARWRSVILDEVPCETIIVNSHYNNSASYWRFNFKWLKPQLEKLKGHKIICEWDTCYRADRIYYANPTMINSHLITPEHIDTVLRWSHEHRKNSRELSGKYGKVYLSRSKWVREDNYEYRKFLDEQILVSRLEKLGWTIVDPQFMTIPQQIHLFENADKVAGPIGSASHTLMACEKFPRVVVYLTDTNKLYQIEANHALQDQMRDGEYDAYYLDAFDYLDDESHAKKQRLRLSEERLEETILFLEEV